MFSQDGKHRKKWISFCPVSACLVWGKLHKVETSVGLWNITQRCFSCVGYTMLNYGWEWWILRGELLDFWRGELEKCKTPFGIDNALGGRCSRRLTAAYLGVTVIRSACVGLQTRTEEGRAVLWTENDEFQLQIVLLAMLSSVFHINMMLHSSHSLSWIEWELPAKMP